jgi:CheY-like chemotaxis protein
VLPNDFSACPSDVLIVEDDPIIALDFEDNLLGLGISTVWRAGTVATALDMIARRAPDFALLDVGLICEESFAVAERLAALKFPSPLSQAMAQPRWPRLSRTGRACQSPIHWRRKALLRP